jgi:hypothetical protein
MGDVGEAFEAMNEHKRKERKEKEPRRFEYAQKELDKLLGHIRYIVHFDSIQIYVGKNRIDFWPFTGWFCGRKPIGKVKGRGINNLR